MAVPAEYLRAARRYGPELDKIAERYRNPVNGERLTGTALILKTLKGESGFNMNAVSSAGAKGAAQFIETTRSAVKERFGVDPWRSPEEAVKGMVLHMQGKLGNAEGLEGYNPGGGSSYVQYILGQRVGQVTGRQRQPSSPAGNGGGGTTTVGMPQAQPLDLQGLLERIQPPAQSQAAPLALPAFAAQPRFAGGPLPTPSAAPAERQMPDLADILASAQPEASEIEVPGTDVRAQPRRGSVSSKAGALRGAVRARGKVIGTPYAGTHTLGNWQSDNAVDLGVPEGTIVQLPLGGVVEKVKGSYSGGRSRFDGVQVTVRFEDGRRAFYTHLSKAHVRPGDRLKAGQAIGRSGSANGVPHVHVGVSRGDPRKLFVR